MTRPAKYNRTLETARGPITITCYNRGAQGFGARWFVEAITRTSAGEARVAINREAITSRAEALAVYRATDALAVQAAIEAERGLLLRTAEEWETGARQARRDAAELAALRVEFERARREGA